MGKNVSNGPKPRWIRFRIPGGADYISVKKILHRYSLHTVCMEARCPNIGECFGCGTATFLIMGDVCTRNCLYCSIKQGTPCPTDPCEAVHVARAVNELHLSHAVITSVTRDDLPFGGADFFAGTISEIKKHSPEITVEILVPDFKDTQGESLNIIVDTPPDIFNHNIEVTHNMYRTLRPKGDYELSLRLLNSAVKKGLTVKSGLMIGFGEDITDILHTLKQLADTGCSILTVGQYSKSRKDGYDVKKYYHPDEFDFIKDKALNMGFSTVLSAPNVRSSYYAANLQDG